MEPKQVHNWSYSSNSSGYILVFEQALLKELNLDFIDHPFLDLSEKQIALVKPVWDHLISESEQQDPLGEKTIICGISYLLLLFKRGSNEKCQNTDLKPKLLLKFSRLIAEHINENITVEQFASKLNLTVDKLNHICKEKYGQSPKAFILEKKITEAKRLLYFTDLSVKEISFQLGFDDSSYFSRIFKRKTNYTPTDFKST